MRRAVNMVHTVHVPPHPLVPTEARKKALLAAKEPCEFFRHILCASEPSKKRNRVVGAGPFYKYLNSRKRWLGRKRDAGLRRTDFPEIGVLALLMAHAAQFARGAGEVVADPLAPEAADERLH